MRKEAKKVEYKKHAEPMPEELLMVFDRDPAFKTAFYSLTPGRQREYIIYFSKPKNTITRIERIEKYKAQIFNGLGLNDR